VRPLGFKPPSFAFDPEVEWVLLRAFAPSEARVVQRPQAARAVALATALDIGARIAARQPQELLRKELDEHASARLREGYLDNVARNSLFGAALDELLAHAKREGVACILLKYAALSRLGILKTGSRAAMDLDVLVPKASAGRFQALLEAAGYRDLGLPSSRHQLPALSDPRDVLIEIHRHIPAVTLPGEESFLEADAMIAADLVDHSSDALLPAPSLVAAHALAHGLVQHARAPHMCSPLKAFADLADLEHAGHSLEQASQFLSRAMSKQNTDDAIALTRALVAGDLEAAQAGGAGTLLRHALASQLDARYAARLRLRILTQPGPTSIHFNPRRLADILSSFFSWIRGAFSTDG